MDGMQQDSQIATPGDLIVGEIESAMQHCASQWPQYLLGTYKYISVTGSTLTRPEADQAPYKRSANRHLGSMLIIAHSSPLQIDVWVTQCPRLRTRQHVDTLTPTVPLTEEQCQM